MTKRVPPAAASIVTGSLWVLAGAFLIAQTPRTPPADQAALPPAKEIVAKYIAATGGEAAYRAIQSIHVKGTFELTAQGSGGPFEDFSARPAKKRTTVQIQGLGAIESGYDGKNAWEISPQTGAAVLSGRQASEVAD